MLKAHAKKSDAVEVVCLEGQIVNGDTGVLRNAVEFESDLSDIILDLSGVTIVDAHGLGVLLQLRQQAIAHGIHFELTNIRRPLYTVFEMTHLDTVFDISRRIQFDSEITNERRNLWSAAKELMTRPRAQVVH